MKAKKMLACMLAMSCMAVPYAGTVSAEEEGVSYPIEGDYTLTIAKTAVSQISGYYDNFSDTPFAQEWQERTGVTIEVDEYADGQAIALMMASGELPDIIFYNWDDYSGGAAKAIADKIIEPLNDYVEYIPDLMDALNMEENFMKDVTTDSGDIIGFPNIKGDAYLSVISGMVTRQDWLDEIGMDVPTTADEFYQMLKAYKEELGIEYPFSTVLGQLNGNLVGSGYLTTPFGLPKADWYQIDGELHYGYAEAEYQDVLEYLHKLYEEGLIDPNFSTIDAQTQRSNFMNGLSGVVADSAGSGVGGFVNSMEDAGVVAIGSLVANEGDTAMSGQFEERITRTYAVITPQCENKEIAAQFLNYLYSEEGNLLANFGIEGESYTIVDGEPIYTDLVMDNPDGLDKQTVMSHYCLSWAQNPCIQEKGYGEQYFNLPEQIAAKEKWGQNDAESYLVPYLAVAEEDQAEYTKLMGDISTYISEMFIHYVDGTKDLADFETDYLGTLEKMGIDRVIEMKQKALDAYNAR